MRGGGHFGNILLCCPICRLAGKEGGEGGGEGGGGEGWGE